MVYSCFLEMPSIFRKQTPLNTANCSLNTVLASPKIKH
ncbi:hypothetical protein FLJC2902T_13530 [Flavobacterium limnosediminis JC2902]|uniref:Uncharacterized protein n=1 Tax=Flavobacterium limnosediminis JC2902 TaxID=1341181 RepID=V6SQ02_9FLAO|nr:hypothetical protein FLJC2902T_13530 [Flavobacterium limnosediminis JC2902]